MDIRSKILFAFAIAAILMTMAALIMFAKSAQYEIAIQETPGCEELVGAQKDEIVALENVIKALEDVVDTSEHLIEVYEDMTQPMTECLKAGLVYSWDCTPEIPEEPREL